jgi:hypothetical protein
MSNRQIGGQRLVGASAFGAAAAGLAGMASLEAAPVFTAADFDIPADGGDYRVDLNADGISEFDIQQFSTVTKVSDFTITNPPTPTSMAAVVMDPGDQRTANLAVGTLIGPGSMWGPAGATPTGGDPLNGTTDDDSNPETPNVPVGHFQVSDGPGYIGVKFLIEGSTHYGYVGYEGTGNENDAAGRVYALGYESVADTAILAGAGAPNEDADFDADGDVDGEDLLIWQQGLGATDQTTNANGDADGNGTVDGADLESWRTQFGEGATAAGAIPEPTSLALLAAGASGLAVYRRRRG